MNCWIVVVRLVSSFEISKFACSVFEEVERMPHLPDDEQRILQELVEVVQQRDALVALLEEERLK